jgi:hypothetical protein
MASRIRAVTSAGKSRAKPGMVPPEIPETAEHPEPDGPPRRRAKTDALRNCYPHTLC